MIANLAKSHVVTTMETEADDRDTSDCIHENEFEDNDSDDDNRSNLDRFLRQSKREMD